jgi:hypothetical protein
MWVVASQCGVGGMYDVTSEGAGLEGASLERSGFKEWF